MRLGQLFEFLENDPKDPFLLYAIATEYREQYPDKARAYYEMLLSEHEDYVGTYYHAAKLYEELGEEELAKITFEKGIDIATRAGEALALRELRSAYEEFMFED